MRDREMSHSPVERIRDRSPHGRRESSPRNHKGRSYSRSPSRPRKSYRDSDRDHDRRYDRERDDRKYGRHMGTRDNPKPSRCLGVFGLSVYTTEDELFHLFSKYGPVQRVEVVIDAKTGRSRGFSFVYFEKVDDAKAAKEHCSGLKINDKNIRVDYSITERAHTPTPGIYMGRPTYKYSDRYDRRRDRDDYNGRSSRHYSRRSPSPYYNKRRRYERSRSRSYSPRR